MIITLWILRNANPHRVDRGFRIGQIFSATSLALGHGLQDAQKSAYPLSMLLAPG